MIRWLLRLVLALCVASAGAASAADSGCCATDCANAWSCVVAPCHSCVAATVAALPPATEVAGVGAPVLLQPPPDVERPAPWERVWTPPD